MIYTDGNRQTGRTNLMLDAVRKAWTNDTREIVVLANTEAHRKDLRSRLPGMDSLKILVANPKNEGFLPDSARGYPSKTLVFIDHIVYEQAAHRLSYEYQQLEGRRGRLVRALSQCAEILLDALKRDV